ncbi:hypothetical protein RhiirC2_795831 [Rhizophagus irregularis]|uniref:DUF8211 domain-containing protein n=1 Tax=Rhizophagus irregularis TaxID=588596 RepID=A0A2N1MAU1_9GLOM|nr:hypothetical protein RhiirC2_795831 [Rhizophagus irregularis]
MSFKRRGCVLHQKLIDLFQYRNDTDHTMDTHPNNKTFHATHLFTYWKKNTTKYIHSQRLRISYKSQYLATDFKYIRSSERRIFERACRSIFNNRGARKDSHVSANNLANQLFHARQYRFLFLPSQNILKPLQHLKYQRTLHFNDYQNYKFPIPGNLIKLKKLKVKRPTTSVTPLQNILQEMPEEIINTHDLPAITIQPIPSDDRNTWHEKLGILVPNDLLPYVTEDPIYVSKRQEKLKGKHHAADLPN